MFGLIAECFASISSGELWIADWFMLNRDNLVRLLYESRPMQQSYRIIKSILLSFCNRQASANAAKIAWLHRRMFLEQGVCDPGIEVTAPIRTRNRALHT